MNETQTENRSPYKQFLALRGIAAFLFGVSIFWWAVSDLSYLALSFLFYAFVDGLLAVIFSFVMKDRGGWIFRAEGFISILAAALTFAGPVVFSAVVTHTGSIFLPYFILARLIVTGMFQVLAIGFLEEKGWRRPVALAGITAMALGVIFIFFHENTEVFAVALAVYSILIGFYLMMLTFIFRSWIGQSLTTKSSAGA